MTSNTRSSEHEAYQQSRLVAETVADFENSAMTAIGVLQNPRLREGVRAVGVKEVCTVLAQTAVDLSAETRRRAVDVDQRENWPGLPGRFQVAWRSVDERSRQLSDTAVTTVRTVIPAPARFQDHFWFVGLGLSTLAAWALVTDRFVIATILVVLRWVGSLAAGGPAISTGIPGLMAIEQQPSIRRHLLTACVASHAVDFIIVGAAAVTLLGRDRPGWALAAALGATLGAYGSLLRVAAERRGTRISRSVVERVVRNVAIGSAVILATLFDPNAGDVWTIPALALAGLGVGLFGLLEILRTTFSLTLDSPPVAAVTLVLTRSKDVRLSGFGEIVLHPGFGDTDDDPPLRVVTAAG